MRGRTQRFSRKLLLCIMKFMRHAFRKWPAEFQGLDGNRQCELTKPVMF